MSHEPSPIVSTPPSRLSTLTSHLTNIFDEAAYHFAWYIVIAIILKMLLMSIAEIVHFIRYCAPPGFLWRVLCVPLLELFFARILKSVSPAVVWWLGEVLEGFVDAVVGED